MPGAAAELQPARPEARTEKEAFSASPRLKMHIAQGVFEGTPQPTVPNKVADASYQALEAQHDRLRAEDNTKQRGLLDGQLTDDEKTKYGNIIKVAKGNKGQPPAASEEEIYHFNHMMKWAATETNRIKHIMDSLKYNLKQREEVGKIFQNILDIRVDSSKEATLLSLFRTELAEGGSFYKNYCTGDTNRKLAKALNAEQMYAIKPFIKDLLGDPTDTAFNALVALRQTQDALEDDAQKQAMSSGASTPLSSTDSPVLDFYKTGLSMVPEKKKSNPTKTTPTQVENNKRVESQRNPNVGESTEKDEEHSKNQDTEFVDPARGVGGIFDGAGGEGRGDEPYKASHAASRAVQEVFASEPNPSTKEEAVAQLYRALEKAKDAILAEAGKGRSTGAIYRIWHEPNGTAILLTANVGDSRVWVRKNDGRLIQVTEDQSTARIEYLALLAQAKTPEEKQNIEKEYATYQHILDTIENASNLHLDTDKKTENIKRYWYGRNSSRLLGGSQNVGTEVREMPLENGDVILLTTDGVHDNLALDTIRQNLNKGQTPQEMVNLLVKKAKEVSEDSFFRSKPDDITAVAVRVEAKTSTSQEQPTATRSTVEQNQQLVAQVQPILQELSSKNPAQIMGRDDQIAHTTGVFLTPDQLTVLKLFVTNALSTLEATPQMQALKKLEDSLSPQEQSSYQFSMLSGGIKEDPTLLEPKRITGDPSYFFAVPSETYRLWKIYSNATGETTGGVGQNMQYNWYGRSAQQVANSYLPLLEFYKSTIPSDSSHLPLKGLSQPFEPTESKITFPQEWGRNLPKHPSEKDYENASRELIGILSRQGVLKGIQPNFFDQLRDINKNPDAEQFVYTLFKQYAKSLGFFDTEALAKLENSALFGLGYSQQSYLDRVQGVYTLLSNIEYLVKHSETMSMLREKVKTISSTTGISFSPLINADSSRSLSFHVEKPEGYKNYMRYAGLNILSPLPRLAQAIADFNLTPDQLRLIETSSTVV